MNFIQSLSSVGSAAATAHGFSSGAEASTEFDNVLQDNISRNRSERAGTVKTRKDEDKDDKKSDLDKAKESASNPDHLLNFLLNNPNAPTAVAIAAQDPGGLAQAEVTAQALAKSTQAQLAAVSNGLATQLKALEAASTASAFAGAAPTDGAFAEDLQALVGEKSAANGLLASAENMGNEALNPHLLAPTGSQLAVKSADAASVKAAEATHHVATPYGQEGWDKAISQRVTWMVQDQLKSASLTLNPPHMGPIQVQIQIENQQVQVQFVSALPEVRQALQEAIPALQEMLNQSGLQLGQSDVSDQQAPSKENPSGQQANGRNSNGNDTELDAAALPTHAGVRSMGSGLVNTFA